MKMTDTTHANRTRRTAGTLIALLTVLATGFAALIPAARAQDASANAQTQSDIELIRAAINANRVDLLANYLQLTDAEATAFWPLYKQYREELNRVSDDQVKLLQQFLQSYDTLSDDEAKKLAEGVLNARKKKVDIQRGYLGKFGKVLPGKKLARLYQLENKVDAVLAYEAADRIPLVPVAPTK